MELAFKNKKIRQLCENEEKAKLSYGVEVAKKLQNRLADLSAAFSVEALPVGKPREINENPSCFTVDLCNGYGIFFYPNHPKNPVLKTGKVDWSKVRRIKIFEIKNYDH